MPVENRYDIKLLPATFSPWTPSQPADRQVAVLMSGGVDSSVTAHLLKDAGWDVLGITMKVPVACNATGRACCGADAAFVCGELGIPHYFIDVTDAFQDLIIRPFREAYASARTPNPCIDCNSFLKFSLVWDFLQQQFGITHLATGHYARIDVARASCPWKDDDCEGPKPASTDAGDASPTHGQDAHVTVSRACLRRAADKDKDQSYFLYGIERHRLPNLILPLGELTKPQVRAIAAERRLPVADKPESMELCFADEQDYRQALSDEQMNRPGDLVDMQGNKIGEHKGIANYTLGQRRGLRFAAGKPVYVARIDPVANTVALGTREEVSTPIVQASQINVLLPEALAHAVETQNLAPLRGKIRSYGEPRPCRIVELCDERVTVEFDEPQFAPCPGQRLVLYDRDETVVAGGTIIHHQ